MPFCNECGAEYKQGDTFCSDCGITLKPIPIGEIQTPSVEESQSAKSTGALSNNLIEEKTEDALATESVSSKEQNVETPSAFEPENKPEIPEPVSSDLVNLISTPLNENFIQSTGKETGVSPAFEQHTADIESAKLVEPESLAIVQEIQVEKEKPISSNLSQTQPETSQKESENLSGELVHVDASDVLIKDANETSNQKQEVSKPFASVSIIEEIKSDAVQKEDLESTPPQKKTEPAKPYETPRSINLEDKIPQFQTPDSQRGTNMPREDEGSAAFAPANTRHTGDRQRPAVRQLREGTMLNMRYEIVRRIGGGGMGAVYLAKDKNLGGAYRAVKEMLQSHLDEAQQVKAVEDFKRESLLLTSLEHVSIPTIYDYFYDEFAGRFYLVMKYISGGDIAVHLRNAPGGYVDELTVARWGMETADVLEYLHTRQPPIIYRDLKPANLMVDGNSGRVMLIDFGIARWVNKEEKGVTAVGTMGYAPPELFSGKVEPRSDVYSLGATMFHILTGNDPQDNPLLIFDFTKNPTPRHINPSMSVEMEQIIMHAVEYKPENRFRSAGELRDTLRIHLDKMGRGELTFTPIQKISGSQLLTEMVFCGFCGGRIAADDLFCAHCGKPQPLSGIAQSSTLRPRITAKLVVAGTTEIVASEFALQKDSNLIGRSDPQSNIFPEVDLTRYDPDTKVSRRHARIWRQGETYLVEDLGSVNGTVVFNRTDKPLRLSPHQPQIIQSGDRIRLGETLLHFFVG